MKKVILALILAFSLGLAIPRVSLAQDTKTCVQVTQYGGGVGVVCGVHTPVEAGLAEDLKLIGAGLVLTSGVFFILSKKAGKISTKREFYINK